MTVLAFDTTASYCSVGLETLSGFLTDSIETRYGQAQYLILMIQRLLEAGHTTFQDLTSVYVTVGPGSFTGIRVGLSTARTLGMALNIPVFGVQSLQAFAQSVILHTSITSPVAVVMDTRRKEIFIQVFRQNAQGHCVPDTEVLSVSYEDCGALIQTYEAEGIMIAGDISDRFASLNYPLSSIQKIDPYAIIQQGRFRPLAPEPIYLRPPCVSVV